VVFTVHDYVEYIGCLKKSLYSESEYLIEIVSVIIIIIIIIIICTGLHTFYSILQNCAYTTSCPYWLLYDLGVYSIYILKLLKYEQKLNEGAII
jgi:hypothetical protein